jgi:hypothetical protein
MNIISAYNQVGTYRGAADLCGTTHKTVRRVVERAEAGGPLMGISFAPQHFLLSHQPAKVASRALITRDRATTNNRFAEILPCDAATLVATRSVTASKFRGRGLRAGGPQSHILSRLLQSCYSSERFVGWVQVAA